MIGPRPRRVSQGVRCLSIRMGMRAMHPSIFIVLVSGEKKPSCVGMYGHRVCGESPLPLDHLATFVVTPWICLVSGPKPLARKISVS